MRAPAFWHRPRPGVRARLLAPLGNMWGAATARAMNVPGLDVGVPVVTVGNFVAGGAGKTPTAIALGRLLIEEGERPAFLSRGYGGAPPFEAVRVLDQSAQIVGDEPLLLSRVAPTFVGPMRVRAAHLALKTVRPTVLVCDDGLQSRTLEPALAIAVVDARLGVGNALCIPAGPLRAPLADQIAHIDALVLVGTGEAGEAVAAQVEAQDKPCFYADLEPEPAARSLAGERVLAFAGIGVPTKFFDMLEQLGARVVATRAFPDHHVYRAHEIAKLQARARSHSALLVTTAERCRSAAALHRRGPKTPRHRRRSRISRRGIGARLSAVATDGSVAGLLAPYASGITPPLASGEANAAAGPLRRRWRSPQPVRCRACRSRRRRRSPRRN